MELVLFLTNKGDLIGFIEIDGFKKKVFCKKLKEKASTGADKFICLLLDEGMEKIGIIVIGNPSGSVRIRGSEGKIVGRGYFGEIKLDIAEFKSKKGKKYLKSVQTDF